MQSDSFRVGFPSRSFRMQASKCCSFFNIFFFLKHRLRPLQSLQMLQLMFVAFFSMATGCESLEIGPEVDSSNRYTKPEPRRRAQAHLKEWQKFLSKYVLREKWHSAAIQSANVSDFKRKF